MKDQTSLIIIPLILFFIITSSVKLYKIPLINNASAKKKNTSLTNAINRIELNKLISKGNRINLISSLSCKNHCSYQGYCAEGICYCKPGYSGDDCSIDNTFFKNNFENNSSSFIISPYIKKNTSHDCFNNCSGNGTCEDHKCICKKDYGGVDCSIRINCKNNCNHGECLNGHCVCYQNFTGEDCSISLKKCKNNCNNQGKCFEGKCICLEGFLGEDCSTKKLDCSNRGVFSETNQTCKCNQGYHGINCESVTCPEDCNNNGKCLSNGLCLCNNGYTGPSCRESINFI